MPTQADKHHRNAPAPARERKHSTSTFQLADKRPAGTRMQALQDMVANSPRAVAQRKTTRSLFGDDLLSRGRQGKLKEGEVQLKRVPDIGSVSIPHLEQSLKPVGNSSSTPVADALASKAASIGNGQVQMKGIEGSSDPLSLARQVGQLRPKDTRIQQSSDGRFELQAKLNPWVSVVTGRSLPELPAPQEEAADNEAEEHKEEPKLKVKDGEKHPTQPGVVWRDVAPDDKPLQAYGKKDTYAAFMQVLADVDRSEKMGPEEKQALKTRLLSEFHHHLKNLPIDEIYHFGQMLERDIQQHEAKDSLEKAFGESRAIYRSWHPPKRISQSTELGAMVEGDELVGADTLNVALNPTRFKNYKAASKASKLPPIGAVPSSLLYPEEEKNTVFLKDRGTATALLPENLYAGFSAYNETVKSLLRGKDPEQFDHGEKAIHAHVKDMRASVTRPVFYDKEDIQSSTGAFNHPDKPGGPHIRKIHAALDYNHNPLKESLDLKLADRLHSNAIFYQTFTQHSKADSYADEWNEMVVKYRSTGHMAGLHKNIQEWVPGLQPNPAINDNLEDSGKFSESYAQDTAKWAKTVLKGEDYDDKKKKKTKK
ncbi:hypothetical protein [Massilia endophytica]|uniref:hypothetical protein n=1 Tax=Massilia endophytica TaxID=2899220 RepID=UPI001E416A2B|nr:hypothetical protein [Massilia endophytica]UGQ45913.1 hypothetical protein LSQ66_19310 [Massilia endophytica]